jgi:hypothetical protein
MTAPTAALAEALDMIHGGPAPWPGGMTSEECAAAILAALPPMAWDDLSYSAGLEDGQHEGRLENAAEIARLNETLNSEIAECVRLRAIEEAARALERHGFLDLVSHTSEEGWEAATALRAALEAER